MRIRSIFSRPPTSELAAPPALRASDPTLLRELSHISAFVARPEYLLAMKCVSMRLGEEFHDLEDVRYLLRYLNLTGADAALEIVTRYFDEEQLLPKIRLALEELLEGK